MYNIFVVQRSSQVGAGRKRFICDRSGPLGNPFVMTDRSEAERTRVCEAFKTAFAEPSVAQLAALRTVWNAWQNSDVELACWYAPKRCHCETLKYFLLRYYRDERE